MNLSMLLKSLEQVSIVRLKSSIHAAFTILGYETTLLGQGQGRVQDGLAIDFDNSIRDPLGRKGA